MIKPYESKLKKTQKSELNTKTQLQKEYLDYDESFDLKTLETDINLKYLEQKKKSLLK